MNNTTEKVVGPQIHLLFTSIITEKRRNIHSGTKDLKNRDRVSIFLTTLRALAELPITSCEFYVELDSTTEWASSLINKEILNLPFKTRLIQKRLAYYSDWVQACKSASLLNSNQVMLLTLDDHVFLDQNIKEFHRVSELQLEIRDNLSELNTMVLLSHFPETHALIPIANCINSLINYKNDLLVPVVVPIGAILISPRDLAAWFEIDFTGGSKFVNPENPYGAHVFVKNGYYIVPRYELFRHLDAYSHIGLKGWPYQVMDPFIKISNKVSPTIYKEPWIFTASLKKPKTKLLDTYLTDSKSSGDFLGFCASVLKSNSIRISFKSIKLVNIDYKITRRKIPLALFYLFLNSHVFRLALLRTFSEFPIRFILKIFNRKFYIYLPHHPIKFYNLISGSSIGYVRFTVIVTLGIIKRRCKKLFGK